MKHRTVENIFVVAFLVLALGCCVGYGKLVYNDWTCGFTHCVRVKEIK